MCGISIVINLKNGQVERESIESVNQKIAHRGPDDAGFYYGSNFAFGHRRLSILDLSQAGHQPMQRQYLCITYNGEIYNYVELREELIQLGHSFVSSSDTEVILAAYEQWGTDAFTKFNGMWAFAIHDSIENEIIFSRDHFGIKPLYFTSTENYFLVGSEIKQFTAVSEFKPVLNQSVAVNFLARGWLNYSDQTFFEGVSELRPGHYLKYSLTTHQPQVKQWYHLASAAVPISDAYSIAVEKVRSLFVDSVRLRMRSDVRVGSCLSGGIDSSSIVSAVHSQKLGNEDFATVTSCYSDKRFDEQKFSDEVTAKTGLRAVKVFPDLNHLLDEGHLDKMIYHQDQPFSSASHYSEFKVFQTAREQNIIVMQDGQGSDEFLCGYGEFFATRLIELLQAFQWGEAFRLCKEKALHRNITLTQEIKSFVKSVYLPRFLKIIKTIIGRTEYPWLSENWRKLAKSHLVEFEGNSIRDLSLIEIEYSSIPYQLHSEDRNSMLFSIESRLPFLDHRLVEYCIGLPSSYKIKDGYTKTVLRDAITELPDSIRYRKDKMGFAAPDPVWVIQNKARVRQDLESIIETTGIFSPDLLNRFDRFVKGELGYEPIYFRAMTFNRFCKIFNLKID
jgi:asparagine synthase (glutamine-hydrolysing)